MPLHRQILLGLVIAALAFGDVVPALAAPPQPAASGASRVGGQRRGLRLRARVRLARRRVNRGLRAVGHRLKLRARTRLARRRLAKTRAGRGLKTRAGRGLKTRAGRGLKTRAGRGLAALGRGLGHRVSRAKRRLGVASARFSRTRAGRRLRALTRGVGRITLAVNARLTQGADWLQPRLPSLLGRVFKGLRVINPITFGAFAFQKIKTDPVFFATYGVFTFAFSNALIPGLMALGVGPVAATILRFATGTPLDIAAITLRTHARRTDRSQRLGDTARALLRDYSDFARERRHRYREHAKSLGRAGGLKRMGAAL